MILYVLRSGFIHFSGSLTFDVILKDTYIPQYYCFISFRIIFRCVYLELSYESYRVEGHYCAVKSAEIGSRNYLIPSDGCSRNTYHQKQIKDALRNE